MPRKNEAATGHPAAPQRTSNMKPQVRRAEYEVDPTKTTSVVCGDRVVHIGSGAKRIIVEMRGDGS